MIQANAPSPDGLPTLRRLNRATLLAAVAAAAILVTTVLPAEYGIDPTGIGGALGLTPMGLTKQAASGQPARARTAAPTGGALRPGTHSSTILPDGTTEIKILLRPFEGKEAKAVMKAGQSFSWRWTTDGEALDYEFHGDRPGAPEGEYESYEKGNAASASGMFKATFDGRHGWYWKNNAPKAVLLTATTKGDFERFAVLE